MDYIINPVNLFVAIPPPITAPDLLNMPFPGFKKGLSVDITLTNASGRMEGFTITFNAKNISVALIGMSYC